MINIYIYTRSTFSMININIDKKKKKKKMEYYIDVDEFSAAEEELLEISEDYKPSARSRSSSSRNRRKWAPADVVELPGAIVYTIDMPGIKPSEISVHVEDGKVLFVKGERKRGEEKEKTPEAKYLSLERRMGKFVRRFLLPDDVNLDAVKAECRDGVVTITVERKPAPEKKRQVIEVKVGADQ